MRLCFLCRLSFQKDRSKKNRCIFCKILYTIKQGSKERSNHTTERKEAMQVEIQLDAACTEPQVIIRTAQMDDAVQALAKRISDTPPQMLTGSRDGVIEILNPSELIRIFADGGKTVAVTENGTYDLRLRLYEAEERLPHSSFVRISKSEIVNLHKVKSFDLSFTGTICIRFLNDTVTYVSRRYVREIKQILGV